jgi:hypothetical protein
MFQACFWRSRGELNGRGMQMYEKEGKYVKYIGRDT